MMFTSLLPLKAQASRRASLVGSHASQEKQNEVADADNLSRIEDDEQLKRFKRAGLLVPIPEGILVDERVTTDADGKKIFFFDPKFRFVRPWVAHFLTEINREFEKQFGHPLQVNSAVRTRVYQEELRKINGNAATTDGSKMSSHLTGATIDIAKLKMSEVEMWWMRNRLLYLEKGGFIEATEEKKQAVFHIMVFKKWDYSKSEEE